MASRPKRKVIITCAVTGSIHTPSMSPYLPVTPDEIAEAAIGAAALTIEVLLGSFEPAREDVQSLRPYRGALLLGTLYAVIGAACMLGGIMHLSLSMTVVLLEATGNTFYSLPLMVTLPVGASLTLATFAVAAELIDSSVPWPSV